MLKRFAAAVLAFVSFSVLAQEAPDALARRVMTEVIEIVKTDKAIQAGDQQRILDLVQEKVLGHFDFARMTALALGREWRTATPEQRKALTAEFQTLLVRSYSNALSQYKNQTIHFKPLRMKPTDTDVIVRTEIRQPGAKPVPIDYEMIKRDDGWKVYDVMVAGVSLVTNYRETFAQEVRTGGIDGLIRSLAERNRQLAAGSSKS